MKNLDFLRLLFDENGDGGNDGANNDNGNGNNGGNNGGGNGDGTDRTTPKYSDEDLDKILSKRFARWQKEQKKATDEAARLATMTAQERAEHERDELQRELDALKQANTLAEMERTARGILQEDGITVSDDIVSVLVDVDADKTSKNVKAFATAFKKSVQAEVKRQLSHKGPTAGSKSGALTKAEILTEKDPIKRQKLIRENMRLFK